MDEIKQKRIPKVYQRKPVYFSLIGVSVVCFVAFLGFSESSLSVNRGDILIAEVQYGDLDVVVEGYGNLRSNKQQLITAQNPATVKEIILKPGAKIDQGSLIVRLENPELSQKYENHKQELVQLKANLRQLKLNQTREQLNESAVIEELKAQLETTQLKRIAHEKLHQQGLVSELLFNETRLTEKQLGARVELLQKRVDQLTLVHKEAINIQLERIKQQEGRLELAKSHIEKLEVRSEISGVLQGLSVELGQSLTAGQEIALVGSVDDLVAFIRIPQTQASLVRVGQKAMIDAQRREIIGEVSRIDPVVDNNSVFVEIALPRELPDLMRPQLSVDAEITTEQLQGVRYIQRPANAREGQEETLYLLNDSMAKAELTKVTFGKVAGRFIELRAGANVNDRFIVSELNNFKSATRYLSIQ